MNGARANVSVVRGGQGYDYGHNTTGDGCNKPPVE